VNDTIKTILLWMVIGIILITLFNNFGPQQPTEERRFIHDIRKISAGKTRRATGNDADIHIVTQGNFARVHFHNLFATTDIGQRDHDLTVEATWTQQSGIEHVGTVGGGDHDHAFIALKPVHFNQ